MTSGITFIRMLISRTFGSSIRRQLILGVAFVHAILMILLVYDLVNRQKQFSLDRSRNRVQFQAELLATASRYQVVSQDLAAIASSVQAFASDSGLRFAMITQADGRVLGHTDSQKVGLFLLDDPSLAVLSGPKTSRVIHEDEDSLVAVAPIIEQGILFGWAWVSTDLTTVYGYLRSVTQTGHFYTLVAILFGSVFALFLAGFVMRPLDLLLRGTERMSLGQLDEPIPITTENEVGKVSLAFNVAMKRLSIQRKELLQSVQQRDEFMSIASHELRTPLTALKLQIQLVPRILQNVTFEHKEHLLKLFENSQQQLEQFSRLVEEILDLSLISAGRLPLVPENVDLSELVRVVVEQHRPELERLGCKVDLKTSTQVQGLWDPVRLRQVVSNLLSNAMKYGAGKSVEISVLKEATLAKFIIRDHGIGIALEDQARIFGRFERATSISQYGGLGLGLFVSEQIVNAHGGSIRVESEGLGRGSAFIVELPINQPGRRV